MARILAGLDDTASQQRVRWVFVILLNFAGIARGFGVDSLFCVFVAGVLLLEDRETAQTWSFCKRTLMPSDLGS